MSFIEGGMDTSRNIGRWKLRQARENMSLHKLELPTFTIYISSTFLPICFSGLIGGFSLLCRWFAWRNNSCLYLGRSCREKGEALCHCHCHFLYIIIGLTGLLPDLRYAQVDTTRWRTIGQRESFSGILRPVFTDPGIVLHSYLVIQFPPIRQSSKPAICFLLISPACEHLHTLTVKSQ